MTSATFKRKTDAKLWAQQTEAAMRRDATLRQLKQKKHNMAELVDRYIEMDKR